MSDPERRQRKQRELARLFLDVANDLRKARSRLASLAATTRPDIRERYAYGLLRQHGMEWACCLYELAARLAIPPWAPPLEQTETPAVPDATEPPPEQK